MAVAKQLTKGEFAGGLSLRPDLDPGNREVDLAPPPHESSLLTLTIELRGSRPRIWRRLTLPGDLTLDAVHTLFQAAMGWTDSHLHRFQLGEGYDEPSFVTAFDEEEGEQGTREEDVRLDQVMRAPGDRLTYLYDFGDGWEHRVTLESLTVLTPTSRGPACLAGGGNGPPEDVGGIHGHHQLAAWLRAGAPEDAIPDSFENAAHAHGWLPDGYDPDAFDAGETTAVMRMWASGEHLPWHSLPAPLADLVRRLRGEGGLAADRWLATLGQRRPVRLDDDEARLAARPWLAVLNAVGKGTKLTAAGYLPPLVVEQIAQATGVTDWWIAKANREDQTWPVAALRETAQNIGLLRKAKGTLAPTARAKATASQPPRLVVSVLQRLPIGSGFAADAGWIPSARPRGR